MALDSTGSDYIKEVPCFLCSKEKLTFMVYSPEYGHNGHELLKYGACIVKDSIKNHKNSQLLKIGPHVKDAESIVVFEPYGLDISRKPYHYSGFYLPDFGESVGQVIFVCGKCRMNLLKQDAALLLQELDTIFLAKVNEN